MLTEKEKMLKGEMYDPLDDELNIERLNARRILKQINESEPNEILLLNSLFRKLIPNSGNDLWIQPPFYCDYGYNIETGAKVFINFNCVILDVMKVFIGNRTLMGPNVQVYTALHPMDYNIRASGLEYAKPVHIGDDVWIGGNVVICPGVRIGDRTVIGAGSVVTRDIPADVFAAGNPSRIIRSLL